MSNEEITQQIAQELDKLVWRAFTTKRVVEMVLELQRAIATNRPLPEQTTVEGKDE